MMTCTLLYTLSFNLIPHFRPVLLVLHHLLRLGQREDVRETHQDVVVAARDRVVRTCDTG